MIRRLLLAAMILFAGCAETEQPAVSERAALAPLPPMRSFAVRRAAAPVRSNASIAADFLQLSFELESGRALPVFTRFEGPVTVRVAGAAPERLLLDLDRLLSRLREEAGIDITRVPADREASITVELVPRGEMRRIVPQAACFVVPRLGSWAEFRARRRSDDLDWTTLTQRDRLAVFIPQGVAPQEMRDCLHEEIAQALGPLNDLYALPDSVFNDDNFNAVLTGFDMLILRTTYAPELRSGMTRAEVAARLPAVLARLNPAGERRRVAERDATPREWVRAVETALGPRASDRRRRAAAAEAVRIARARGWEDSRLAFALYALGRLSLPDRPDVALGSFLEAGSIYAASPDTQLQSGHVAMQLAAYALSSGQPEAAIEIVDAHLGPVAEAENAALLATLLMVKAEALATLGRRAEAREVRAESLGWARYGFGTEAEVRARAEEVSALAPPPGRSRS